MRLAYLILILSLNAASLSATPIKRAGKVSPAGYDELTFLGWNNACSVAFQYLSYPPVGTGMRGDPDTWRVGSMTIDPDGVDVEAAWVDEGTTSQTWDEQRVNKATEELIRTGYAPAGTSELLRRAPVAERRGLHHVLHSTTAFRLSYRTEWPPPEYELSEIHYSPLSNCAFLLFRDFRSMRDSFRYKLVRMLNPDVRRTRARAHVTNAIFLYKNRMNIYGAEEELRIAADMDPEYPLALYYHAALLATHGQFDESLERLKAAVKYRPEYAQKAKGDPEFEELWEDTRFIAIAGKRSLFPVSTHLRMLPKP